MHMLGGCVERLVTSESCNYSVSKLPECDSSNRNRKRRKALPTFSTGVFL